VPPGRLAEPLGDLVGIEAQPRLAAGSDAAGAEAIGVLVDPPAAHPQPPGDLLRGEEAGGRDPGIPVRQRLAGRRDRLPAHRRLPEGVRLTFGLPGASFAWWAIRAAAISM
jgi:hypothetical protein